MEKFSVLLEISFIFYHLNDSLSLPVKGKWKWSTWKYLHIILEKYLLRIK